MMVTDVDDVDDSYLDVVVVVVAVAVAVAATTKISLEGEKDSCSSAIIL